MELTSPSDHMQWLTLLRSGCLSSFQSCQMKMLQCSAQASRKGSSYRSALDLSRVDVVSFDMLREVLGCTAGPGGWAQA